MQILHPTTGGLYTGITNAVSTIYRIEGWRTLWKGVSSVIVGAGMLVLFFFFSFFLWSRQVLMNFTIGPAHAVYFGTYEAVKELAGGNVDDGHHPVAAGKLGFTVKICFTC